MLGYLASYVLDAVAIEEGKVNRLAAPDIHVCKIVVWQADTVVVDSFHVVPDIAKMNRRYFRIIIELGADRLNHVDILLNYSYLSSASIKSHAREHPET